MIEIKQTLTQEDYERAIDLHFSQSGFLRTNIILAIIVILFGVAIWLWGNDVIFACGCFGLGVLLLTMVFRVKRKVLTNWKASNLFNREAQVTITDDAMFEVRTADSLVQTKLASFVGFTKSSIGLLLYTQPNFFYYLKAECFRDMIQMEEMIGILLTLNVKPMKQFKQRLSMTGLKETGQSNIQSTVIIFLLIILVCLVSVLTRNESESTDYYDIADQVLDIAVDTGVLDQSQALLNEKLLGQRVIVLSGSVNAASCQRLVASLIYLDRLDPNAPIDLYLRSDGGWSDDAFAIIEVIQNIHAPVNTCAMGGTHSSGAMILAAGTGNRSAYPSATIMFHAGLYESNGVFGEDTHENKRLIRFWMQHSKLPDKWVKQHDDEQYYMNAEQALKYGVVDEICQPTSEDQSP